MKRGQRFGHFEGSISVFHKIGIIVGQGFQGSKDLVFAYKRPNMNQWESVFTSSVHDNKAIHTIAHPGAIDYTQPLRDSVEYQRPALYIFDNYNRYYDSI